MAASDLQNELNRIKSLQLRISSMSEAGCLRECSVCVCVPSDRYIHSLKATRLQKNPKHMKVMVLPL